MLKEQRFKVLKGAHNILSNSKRIKLLIEIHDMEIKVYKPIVEILDSHNFKIIFEKDGPKDRILIRHIIAEKKSRIDKEYYCNLITLLWF